MTEPSDVVLEIHCPRSVYQTLRTQGKDKQTLAREARESLALRLYGEHRLSLGKAAELAALPIVKFMESDGKGSRTNRIGQHSDS